MLFYIYFFFLQFKFSHIWGHVTVWDPINTFYNLRWYFVRSAMFSIIDAYEYPDPGDIFERQPTVVHFQHKSKYNITNLDRYQLIRLFTFRSIIEPFILSYKFWGIIPRLLDRSGHRVIGRQAGAYYILELFFTIQYSHLTSSLHNCKYCYDLKNNLRHALTE